MKQQLFVNVMTKGGTVKYHREYDFVKGGHNQMLILALNDVMDFFEEKNIHEEDCIVNLNFAQTAKNSKEQREQDKIYNPLIDISDSDLVKRNFPDTDEVKALRLTEGEEALLPYFCALLNDKDIARMTKTLEVENIHKFRTGIYHKFMVTDKYGLLKKAKDLVMIEEPCPVCAKRKLKKKK